MRVISVSYAARHMRVMCVSYACHMRVVCASYACQCPVCGLIARTFSACSTFANTTATSGWPPCPTVCTKAARSRVLKVRYGAVRCGTVWYIRRPSYIGCDAYMYGAVSISRVLAIVLRIHDIDHACSRQQAKGAYSNPFFRDCS